MSSIVLIEPDKRVAELYRSSLEAADSTLSVSTAHDAQQALHVIEAAHPNLILLELDMAMHNGFEFLYEFISYDDWKHIPVIVLSRLPETYFRAMSASWQELGVVDYLYKADTSLHRLQERVGEVLVEYVTA